jgi:dTMP kinase
MPLVPDDPLTRGWFVALEGGEASGKSTQAARLAEHLGAVLTREPGGTRLGEAVRALLLDPDDAAMSDRAEALLFAAARAQHVHEVIGPALAQGRHVVTDRFAASSFAYQAFGRGLDLDQVRSLSAFAVDGVWPDLNVLLVVPPEVATARLDQLDRLEGVGPEFHARVAAGFATLCAAEPDRWVQVDATGTVDEVAARVQAVVDARMAGGVRP